MSRMYIKNCTGGPEGKEAAAKASSFSKLLSRIIFYILLIGFLGVSGYVLFFSQYLQITNITISGTQELKSQDIEQVIKASAQGKFWNVIPKNNFLFFPQKRIENLLKDNFKKIRGVTVARKFPDSISIEIDERKAVMVWCSAEDCFLIDENGVAYSTADFSSPEIVQNNLIRINDSSGKSFSIGEQITKSEYEKYALGLKSALKNIGFEISDDAGNAYGTPSNMADEIDVKTQQGTDLYFSTQFSLENAMRTLDVALKKGIEDKQKGFEHIDLRSENKVYYKLKNTENESQPENKNNDSQSKNKTNFLNN